MTARPKHAFFPDGDSAPGITYNTPDEMAAYLHTYPEMLLPYMDSVHRLAAGMVGVGAIGTIRDELNFMCDVLVCLAQLKGERYYDRT